jgi:hypothetical protein
MAGLKVVSVQTLPDGSLDLADLKAKAQKHKDQLAAFMVRAMFIPKSLLNLDDRSPTPLRSAYSRLVCRT